MLYLLKTLGINSQKGFNLLELMIAIAIISILSAIAAPTYLHYTRKAYYSEIVMAVSPYKLAISECFHMTGNFAECNGGSHGIPANITHPTGGISSLQVENGIITVIPAEKNGLTPADSYILKPADTNNMLTWQVSGGGLEKGYVKAIVR